MSQEPARPIVHAPYDRYADILISLALETRAKIATVDKSERQALVEMADALDAGALYLRIRDFST